MPIFNFILANALPTESALFNYNASQSLMDVLMCHRFAELPHMGGLNAQRTTGKYVAGQVYYFRKHGQCTVQFLKDGRVHVLQGPIAMWNLHDNLTPDELNILIAFATLCEEQQEVMRNYMAPKCKKYTDVLRNMPAFNVDWKKDFLEAFSGIC